MGRKNNKLKDQKGLDRKSVRQAKQSTEKNSVTGQKDYFKSIWLEKIYIHKNKKMQTVAKQEKVQKEIIK